MKVECRPGRAGSETRLRKSSIAGLFSIALTAGAVGSPAEIKPLVRPAAATPVSYLSLSFPSRNQGFVAASRGSAFLLLSTSSDGRSWKHFKLGFGIDIPNVSEGDPGAGMRAIQFVSAAVGWIAGYSLTQCLASQPQDQSTCPNALFVTHNGGKSWTQQIALGQPGNLDGFEFVNRTTGWAMTSQCRVAKGQTAALLVAATAQCGYQQVVQNTTDGGKRWSREKWKISNITGFHFRDARNGWAVTRPPSGSSSCYSAVYVTANGGKKWKRVLRLPSECQALTAFGDAKHGWVLSADSTTCGTGGCANTELRRTRDSGHSWTVEQGAGAAPWQGTSGFPQELGFADPKHGWMTFRLGTSLQTQGGIAMTSNGGVSWTRSLPCYAIEPGAAAATGSGGAWLAGSWVSYCSQPKGSGLFHSTNWGKTWRQIWPKV
jgi:photosystem II stability/assembly factor-like uncharacterized protein